MQIDNKALSKLLSQNDDELKKIISAAAGEGGVSIPSISGEDIAKIRAALGSIESDPSIMSEILKTANPKKKNPR